MKVVFFTQQDLNAIMISLFPPYLHFLKLLHRFMNYLLEVSARSLRKTRLSQYMEGMYGIPTKQCFCIYGVYTSSKKLTTLLTALLFI